MIITKFAADVKNLLQKHACNEASIGFVPTMGALHPGHISLVTKCKEECDVLVSSIFINPTQFNNADDYNKYPVTIEKDIYTLEKNGCDILYLPGVNDIYPEGTVAKEFFDLGDLENILEGKYRPGHFQGVCQVVKRLLEIVNPTHLFLGQKDYQQCMVIRKLLALEKFTIALVICPTLREANGLAMSSRNLRLSAEQKQQASNIYKTLMQIKENIRPGKVEHLKKEAAASLLDKNIYPDYVEIADASDLRAVDQWDGINTLVVLTAALVGGVRLIDNILLQD